MNAKLRKSLLVAAEVALVLAIVALLVANWIPIVIGARPFRVAP